MKPLKNPLNERKTIRMNPTLIQEIEKMAKKQNRSFSNMVVTILTRYINKP